MTYPNYSRKHLEEALFSAHDFVRYKKVRKELFPQNYVLAYQLDSLKHFKRKYAGQYDLIKFSPLLRVHKIGNVGFVKFDGFGAPQAVASFEELIALGGKRFVNMGTAGGLQRSGVFLCNKAIRDEGTSSHYIPHSKYAYPDEGLTKKLGESMERVGIEFETAPTWTIDAPFRETNVEIEQYHREGVATVEMEASALFAVGALRKVKVASAFAVSDVLKKKWEPKFHEMDLKKNLGKLVDAAIECLK